MRWFLALVLALPVAVVGPTPAAASDVGLTVVVTNPAGHELATATATIDGRDVRGNSGRFAIDRPGFVRVTAPAYETVGFRWDGRPGRLLVELAPRRIQAIRAGAESAGDPAAWRAILDLADTSAANALVLDLKDESGFVFSQTPSERAVETGAQLDVYDLAALIAEAHDRGLYVVVRIVAFQDPVAGAAMPDWAAWDTARERPFRKGVQVFLDPWDLEARRYALDLAVDACAMGADEVQFDYVRFPDGFGSAVRFDGPSTADGRREAITTFLDDARRRLGPQGCATAAAIFGFITSTPGEGGIGQHLETVAQRVDVVSPMIYPSHYGEGWFGFADPNAHPYDVVWRALADGQPRLADSTVVVRPWLQSFFYTSRQIQAEREAAADRGVGWMLWNVRSSYSLSSIGESTELERLSSAVFWAQPPVFLSGSHGPALVSFWIR